MYASTPHGLLIPLVLYTTPLVLVHAIEARADDLLVVPKLSPIVRYSVYAATFYLTILFGMQLPEYLLFAVFAVAVHVLVGQKYIGHLVAIVAFMVILLAPMFGIEHNMLIFGAGPWWTYTEMRGFTPSSKRLVVVLDPQGTVVDLDYQNQGTWK